MELLENLDLLSVGVAIAGTVILGFAVFFADRESSTNKTFLLFTLVTAIWGTLNYLSYKITNLNLAFWFLRFEIFFAVWHTLLIFQLLYLFPNRKNNLSKKYYRIVLPIATLTSFICLTPLVFSSVKETTEDGFIKTLNVGPGIALFTIFIITFIIAAFYSLARKINVSKSKEENKQLTLFFTGGILMFLPIIVLIFIFPAFLEDSRFIPFAAVFIFPFVLLTSYSILKYRLFNIKVVATAILVFVLSIVAFGEVIFARETSILIYRSSIFVLILIFGILLIKGVLREVSLREQLEEANKAQENLLHFITHQIKGFLTKSRYIFAELLEGSFGSVNGEVKKMAEEGFKINTDGVSTVQTILNAANIKTGQVAYEMKPLNLKELVRQIFEKNEKTAVEKGLSYNLEIDESKEFIVNGDIGKLTEAFSNLIDNSIRYTPKGSIKVSLVESNNAIKFKVKDTGVGIAKEDMEKIFGEGVRGKDALKVNVDSTGFGLYIVKNIIEAHGGKVYAESEGPGKGSEFVAELPVKSK